MRPTSWARSCGEGRAGDRGGAEGRAPATWRRLNAGLTALALTTGPTLGSTAEALRVMTYSSPLLTVLSFCGAARAFSGRRATRRFPPSCGQR